MNVLVTGGLGFIGLNFVLYYHSLYKEDKITVVDKMTYACNDFAVKKHSDKFFFIKGDISDEVFVDKLFEIGQFDIVVNFAAESHVDNSIKSSHTFYISNVLGVQVLLDACRKYGIKRFHQVSTDEVYGDVEINDDFKFNEKSILNPSNPYSASKAASDLMVLAYYRTYNIPVSISRCTNNYGLYQHFEKFIPTIIINANNKSSIPVYGDGKNIRNWIHVEDHCKAIDVILHQGKIGEIYNIGSEEYISNIDLVKYILIKMGLNDNYIKYVTDRPGHDRKYSIDYTKIQSELEWSPVKNIKNEINTLISYYANKENFLD